MIEKFVFYWLASMLGVLAGYWLHWLTSRAEISDAALERQAAMDLCVSYKADSERRLQALTVERFFLAGLRVRVRALYDEHKMLADRAIGIPNVEMVTAVESAKASVLNQVLGLFEEK